MAVVKDGGGVVPVTITDVARRAGVSKTTVSLVLRDSSQIPEATRERVRAVMAALDYRPSRLAAGLKSARSYLVGLVVIDLAMPHVSQTVVGIESALEAEGYSVIVANSHTSVDRERRHIETLMQYRVDGLLVHPVQGSPDDRGEHLGALLTRGYPFVCLNQPLADLPAPYCGNDPYPAMRRLVAYLVEELGHRHVALLSGTQRTSTSLARLVGWRDELAAHGLPASDSLVAVHSGDRPGGTAGMTFLLERRERGASFTAVVAVNDLVALGAMDALAGAGLRVPEDVSVAGMGGTPELQPPGRLLTSIVDDHREIGYQSGLVLLEQMSRHQQRGVAHEGAPEQRVIPGVLRIGATTGPAPTEWASSRKPC